MIPSQCFFCGLWRKKINEDCICKHRRARPAGLLEIPVYPQMNTRLYVYPLRPLGESSDHYRESYDHHYREPYDL